MRCPKCGTENAGVNRFCGMCGARLAAEAVPPPQVSTRPAWPVSNPETSAPGSEKVAVAGTTEPRRIVPATPPGRPSQPSSFIAGPSFLGLNSPGPAPSSSHDSHSSSGNLDYLLDDDEEPKSGRGKFFLIVLALALAVGFGYLRFRQGGFDWLTSSNRKPASSADVPQNSSPNEAQQNDVLKTDAPNNSAAPAPTPGNSASPSASDGAANSNNPPAAANGAPASADTPATQSNSTQPDSASPTNGATPAASATPTSPNAAAKTADSPAASASDTPDETPAPAKAPARSRERKPSPSRTATPVERNDSVVEAESYIYGRGAAQDCDRGVRLLKTTAQQSNAKAMISLGALYSTGTCTPRDLPTAYRWFALALHKQPDNQTLQDDLKSLWDKMTPPERQLAIKLSQ